MLNGKGFMKPLRMPRLDLPSQRASRPLTLWLGASALLVAAAFNLVTYVTGVFSLLSQDFEESTTVVLLVALSLAAVFLVVLPLWTGIAALRGSATAAGWAILYFVAQFLVAFQSLDLVQYVISAVALAAAILLWIPATRAYSRGSKAVRQP